MYNFEDNMLLVNSIYNKYFNCYGWLKEDLMQVGYIGLNNACNSFNASLGFKFSTFASMCIKNEMLNLVNKELKYENNNTELNDCVKDDTKEYLCVKQFVNSGKVEILRLWYMGYNQSEIAKITNHSRAFIKKKLEKEKNMLQNKLL